MAGARTLVARFTGDTSALEASTKRANAALGSVGKGAEKQTGRMSKAFSGLSAAFAGVAIADFAKDAVNAAGEVQDSTSALSSAFGKSGDEIVKWADKSAAAFNVSKREALDAGLTFANFGKAAGKTGDQLAKFATDLTARAAESASFFGGSTKDAIEAFGAALRGESEPIRRYGVLLSDNAIKAEAYASGIAHTGDQLTEQQKVQARANLIMKDTKQVVGDVTRTQDSFTTQTRAMATQLDNLKVSIGEKLLPVASALLKFLIDYKAVIGPLVLAVGGLAAAVFAVNTATRVWASTTKAFNTVQALFLKQTVASTVATEEQAVALSTAGRAGRTAAVAFGAIGVAIGATLALPSIYNKLSDILVNKTNPALVDTQAALIDIGRNVKTKKASAALDDFGDSLDRLFNKTDYQKFQDKVNAPFVALGFQPAFKKAQDNIKQLDTSLADLVGSGHAKDAAAQFDALAAAAKAHGVSVDELRKKFPQYADALQGVANQSKLAGGAIDATTGSMEKQETAADRLKRVVGDLGAMFDKLFGNLTADKAMAGFQAALDDLTGKVVRAKGAFEQNGRALNLNSAAGRDLLGVIDSQAQALADLSTTTLDQTHSQVQARIVWNQGVDALKAQWRQAGLTNAQIAALTTRYGLVPRGVSTAISTTGIPAASSEIASYNEKLGKIPATVITRLAIEEGSRRKLAALTKQGFAAGGPVFGPGGPRSDLVPAWLSSGEFVINAMSAARIGMSTLNRLNRMSVGGPVPKLARGGAVAGGGTVNHFTINGAVDPEGVARQIQRILGGHGRRVGTTAAI